MHLLIILTKSKKIKQMKKILLSSFVFGLFLTMTQTSCTKGEVNGPDDTHISAPDIKSGYAGYFTIGDIRVDTRHIRVLYIAEGTETGAGDSSLPLLVDAVDVDGNPIKAYRYQITVKNTGFDDVGGTDPKMKNLKGGGVKLFLDVPVEGGQAQISKALVGNFGYTLDDTEDRTQFAPEQVDNIRFNLETLELPDVPGKPGDSGIVNNAGRIKFTFSADTEGGNELKIKVDSEISVTHARGSDKLARVQTNPEVIKKNVK